MNFKSQNKKEENLENVFEKALILLEENKGVSEILEKYPSNRKELEEFFGVIEAIKKNKEVYPPKELLFKILEKMEISENKKITEAFSFKFQRNIFSKLSLSAAIAVFVLIAGFYWLDKSKDAILPKIIIQKYPEIAREKTPAKEMFIEKNQSKEVSVSEIENSASNLDFKITELSNSIDYLENLNSDNSFENFNIILSGISG